MMIKPGMFIADRYEIIDKVGSGGMADVYKARCHKLNRFVAVKILKPEFSHDANFVVKFRGEAQSAAGLSHPNIVNVYDVGEDNGLYFIVMELIEGITLKNFIERKGRLDIREAIGIGIQIAQGMEAAHANHIIHRDIKPQNIIISKEGKVKVADFGIAKATTSNTLTSTAMGSVHYISPEQARGGYSDERSDVYSLGVTLYEMISGIVPFEGDNAVSIALLHIQGEARTLGELIPGVPVSIDRIVQKCMQKKPERRYQSSGELIADLKHAIMEPNMDFVMIPTDDMINESPTIALSPDDLNAIRNGAMQNDMYNNGMMNNGYDNMMSYNNAFQDQGFSDSNNTYGYMQQDMMQGHPDMMQGQPGMMQDQYGNELGDPEEEVVDPKVERVAVSIAVGVTALIIVVLVAVLLFACGVIGGSDDKKPTTSTTPTVTEAADTTFTPSDDGEEDGDVVEVPSFENRTVDRALSMAGDAWVIVEREEASKDVPEGYIIRQEPEPGSKAETGSEVYVYVSTGDDSKPLVKVDNMTQDMAQSKIKADFPEIQFEVVMESSDNVDEGFVIRTEPEGGSEVSSSLESITLYVSSGKEIVNATVPNLLGKTLDQAKKALESVNLKVGNVTEEYNDEYAEGRVCAQKTSQGMLVPEGSSVNIVVSKGEEVSSYTYKITVNVPSSATNPFDDPNNSDNDNAVTSGDIIVKLSQGNTQIDKKTIKSSYDDFASSGLSYTYEYTTDVDNLTKSNFAVEFVLNNQILSLSPNISVSSPSKN